MTALMNLRTKSVQFLVYFLLGHIPVTAGFCLAMGLPWIEATAITAVLALSAAGMWFWRAAADETLYVVAVALMGTVAALVYAMAGHPWQIDMHMYFFAALAMLAAMCDWRALIVAAAVAAVHHLSLNFVLPEIVFPGGSDFFRVVFHAVIVVLETGVLIWVTGRISGAFANSEEALTAAAKAEEAVREAQKSEQASRATLEDERRRTLDKVAQTIEAEIGGMADSVATASSELDHHADDLRTSAEQVQSAASLSEESSNAAESDVTKTAQAVEELGRTSSEISRMAGESGETTRQAVEEARKTNEAVSGLADAGSKIGEVVGLIQDIAEQTNLLALNATIEAARAGDAGKGFAVVANEVKALASQTAKATENISNLIASMQNASGGAVSAIQGIGDTIGKVASTVGSIEEAVARQEAVTKEIADTVSQVSDRSQSAARSVATVRNVANDSQAACNEVKTVAGTLNGQSKELCSRVNEVLATLRAS